MLPAFKIKIPLINKQPSKSFQQDLAYSSPKMIEKYGNIFRAAAAAYNMPVQVLYTIAFIESTGNATLSRLEQYINTTDENIGIMQVQSEETYSVIKDGLKKSLLPTEHLQILKKYIPSMNFALGSTLPKFDGNIKVIFFNAIKNVEFNIWAGAAIFRKYLSETQESDGTIRLDKAVLKFNRGINSSIVKSTPFKSGADSTALFNAPQNDIYGKSYIVKSVGVNGALYFFVKNNIN